MGAHRRPLASTAFILFAACGGELLDCQPPDSGDIGTFTITETLVSNQCGAQAANFQLVTSYTADIAVNGSSGVFRWTPGGSSETDGTYDSTTGAFTVEQVSSTQVVAASAALQTPGCILDTTDILQGILGTSYGDGGISPLVTDAGPVDAGVDAGPVDTGVDAGPVDTGGDAGNVHASDASADAVADATASNGLDAGAVQDAGIDAGLGSTDVPVVAQQRVVFSGTEQIIFAGESGGDCSSQVGGSPGQYTVLPCTVTYTVTGVLQ